MKNYMRWPKFEIFRGKNDQFYFRLKAPNGKIIAQSEGYKSKDGCVLGITSVKGNAEIAQIHDLTK